jgi:uncharacterized membrane protein
MTHKTREIPVLRKPTLSDFKSCLALGTKDYLAAPFVALFFASFFALAGLAMALITYWTGHTFWLVLAVLGFPLIGTLSCVGFYESSRRLSVGIPVKLSEIIRFVWLLRLGQLPWLATIIIVIFLFWFFLGHMIFALFLGLSPMTNVTSSFAVFLTPEGAMMIALGSLIGAFFASFVFAMSIHGIPMLVARNIDFVTAILTSIAAVAESFLIYVLWGLFIALVTLIAMLPLFLGLFVAMPIFGHATWHLYDRLSDGNPATAQT